MATIYNSELSKELILGAKIQTSRDRIPTELAEKVIPVMEVNPKLLRVANVVKGNNALNGDVTIYTTPTDKDFYLTGASLSVVKDATATSTLTRYLITTEESGLGSFLPIGTLTLTAESRSTSINLSTPLKLKRNTTVSITNSTTVGNIATSGSIIGFTIDNPNA